MFPEQQPAQFDGPQVVAHIPQSPGQTEQLSDAAQTPSPQAGPQPPQSDGQLAHDSPAEQTESPHPAHMQSAAQVLQLSPSEGLQRPSLQKPGALFGQPARVSESVAMTP